MAQIRQMTADEQAELDAWVATRPQAIKDLMTRVKINTLYRLILNDGRIQRVFPVSYAENGTVTVAYTGEYNLIEPGDFER